MELFTTHDTLVRYLEIRNYTESLCEPLHTEDYIPQPAVFVSPPKWHLGHTTWFFEEFILKKHLGGYKVFHPKFSFLFNSYYNLVGDRVERANRGVLTRPSVKEVFEYRKYVDQKITELFQSNPENINELETLLELGLNHEQQHQELFITDTKYTLSLNPLKPEVYPNTKINKPLEAKKQWLKLDEGIYDIGFEGDGFCYDNELGRHKVFLHSYEITDWLVTNREYVQFIEDDGYERFDLWLDEGWAWRKESEVDAPLYWKKIEGKWFTYTLAGMKELDLDATLSHVSYYEAAAFAEWKGMRLPTEFEWEAASDQFNWGTRWEWTNSAYLPYPKFAKAEGAIGEYNGKFMINQMVLRGASVATSPNHSRKTYRNFFHPHYQWQFTGIRLARSI
ncbi:ergothioneine biosynthesis protein EgtB [Sediminitomix flava]|uniref:Ergothioneine biosynthesis protein EgtB n=1 Tax=Sediminitomix flava TaxID=379075 RepID=A0A315ZAK6_SEDFL|nr:ergothioneine biosynthesis protein EgtB [Sediminitomix flava]PWJ42581.1 ergothioneine biosynthesis protein EgtB [Sediminitomix flava]